MHIPTSLNIHILHSLNISNHLLLELEKTCDHRVPHSHVLIIASDHLRSHFLRPSRSLHASILVHAERHCSCPIPRDKENDEEKEEEDGRITRLFRPRIDSIDPSVGRIVRNNERRDTGGGRVYTARRPCCARASVACAHGSLTSEAFASHGRLLLSSPWRGKLECRLLPPFHRGQPRFFPPSRAYTTHIVCRTRACAVCPILARGINHNVEGQGRTSRASFQLSSNFNLRGVFIYFEECTFFFFFFLIGGR